MTTGLVGTSRKKKRWRDRISEEHMEIIVKVIIIFGLLILAGWVLDTQAEHSQIKARCQFCVDKEQEMCEQDKWSAEYVKKHCMWITEEK